jgi:branched-chain amino acid transport system ATP-binding protein
MTALLEVRGLCSGYGESQVLDEVSFSMGVEAVGILGRNGMGKTTLCDTLMGLVRPTAGEVLLHGERIDGRSPSGSRGPASPTSRRAGGCSPR